MRKFFATMFILILVTPLLTASLLSIAVRSWIFNRDFYNQLFEKRAEFILENPNLLESLIEQKGGNEEFANALTAAFYTVITPKYLEEQMQGFVDQLFEFFQGTSFKLNFQIDLTPIKDDISGEKKTNFVDAFVNNLPTCNTGKYARFPQSNFEYCLSMSTPSDILKQRIAEEMLPLLLTFMPDTINATSIDFSPITKWTSMFGFISIQQLFNIGLITLLVISILLWLVLVFIADKRFRIRLRWLGGALFLPAILTITSGFLVQSNTARNWVNLRAQQFSGTPLGADLATSILDTAQTAASRIGVAFLVVGVVAIGGASILLALGILIKPRVN